MSYRGVCRTALATLGLLNIILILNIDVGNIFIGMTILCKLCNLTSSVCDNFLSGPIIAQGFLGWWRERGIYRRNT